ncbi:hypothetical protein Q3G72_027195 [Acer saccharum]|nr:hypothetical protein Q3G72_027195 [Acer saccharum]
MSKIQDIDLPTSKTQYKVVDLPCATKLDASGVRSGEWEGAGAGAVGTGTGGEASSDVVAPVLKKSKGTNSPPEDAGGQSVAPLENIDSQMAIEESSEAVGDLPQGSNEEGFDAEKEEVDNTGDKAEELKESE